METRAAITGAAVALAAAVIGAAVGAHLSDSRRRARAANRGQPWLMGVVGGLGPKATALFYDVNIIAARVLLFAAMQRAQSGSREEMLAAVRAASTAEWTADEAARVWAARFGQDDKLRDQDHVALLTYANPMIPGRPEFMSGASSADPTEDLARTARALVNGGARALCMVCSTAHRFKRGMLRGLPPSVEWLDMLDLTYDYLLRQPRGGTPGGELVVGLMGTEPLLRHEIYERAFAERAAARRRAGLEDVRVRVVTPLSIANGEQASFNEAIFGSKGIKAGFDADPRGCAHARRNLELLLAEALKLRFAGADAIVLGCTELPLLLTPSNCLELGDDLPDSNEYNKSDAANLLLVNPAQILGDEIVRRSLTCREYA